MSFEPGTTASLSLHVVLFLLDAAQASMIGANQGAGVAIRSSSCRMSGGFVELISPVMRCDAMPNFGRRVS